MNPKIIKIIQRQISIDIAFEGEKNLKLSHENMQIIFFLSHP